MPYIRISLQNAKLVDFYFYFFLKISYEVIQIVFFFIFFCNFLGKVEIAKEGLKFECVLKKDDKISDLEEQKFNHGIEWENKKFTHGIEWE